MIGDGLPIVVALLISGIGGYLLGSAPFGLLLTRFAGLGDIRDIGSGNIGATNVLRTGRKDLAAATLILDSGKGAIAVFLARMAGLPIEAAGAAAFLGHCYPVWLGFNGGKGVATYLGTVLALSPLAGVAACIVWLMGAGLTRISSLAALAATAATPLIMFSMGAVSGAIAAVLMTTLVHVRHKDNVKRLIAGTEPMIGNKSPALSKQQSASTQTPRRTS
ncbi:MAG: glycerol-3-phosphate 1-O-acyltransferase PlsY [Pseudomonadota bacterium]